MTERDSAANLDFWSGRARGGTVGQDPEPPRKPYRSSRAARLAARLPALRRVTLPTPRGQARPVAAAALLAGLTVAWLFVGHQSHGSAAPSAFSATTTPPMLPTTVAPAESSPSLPPVGAISFAARRTDRCEGVSASRPHVLCIVDGVIMEVALYTPGTVGAAFRRIAGAPVPPRSGPAACAADRPDERAWSLASAPLNAVGRFVCRREGARAGIWWTHGDRLLHAVAGNPRDSDLAKLFSWWRAHPSA